MPRPNVRRRAFRRESASQINSLLFLRDLMRYEVHHMNYAERNKLRAIIRKLRKRANDLEEVLEYIELRHAFGIPETSESEDGNEED
eukprot:snap_masked-scaffold_44-processed-gene-1.46-mRNA-1 protein AED:1.00 eAED:1.00 QI:0/-1/0/0/-1/1/1/0/86